VFGVERKVVHEVVVHKYNHTKARYDNHSISQSHLGIPDAPTSCLFLSFCVSDIVGDAFFESYKSLSTQ
jgi:hypothetical protein